MKPLEKKINQSLPLLPASVQRHAFAIKLFLAPLSCVLIHTHPVVHALFNVFTILCARDHYSIFHILMSLYVCVSNSPHQPPQRRGSCLSQFLFQGLGQR